MWVYKLDSSADIYDTMIVDLSTVEQGVTDPSGGLNEGCEMVYWTRLTHSDTTLHTPPKGAPAFFKSHDDYRSYYGKTSGSWTVHHNDSDNKAKYLNSGDLFWYPFKDGEIARGNSTYIKFDGLISYDSPFLGMLDSTISLSCNIDLDPLKFKHFTNMYLAKNIGVVQIKYTNGDVWNLVDYKIKK